MRRTRTKVAAGAAALGLLVAAAPSFALSDERACTDPGGTYVTEQGAASCQFPLRRGWQRANVNLDAALRMLAGEVHRFARFLPDALLARASGAVSRITPRGRA
jgi:hypothetical protein